MTAGVATTTLALAGAFASINLQPPPERTITLDDPAGVVTTTLTATPQPDDDPEATTPSTSLPSNEPPPNELPATPPPTETTPSSDSGDQATGEQPSSAPPEPVASTPPGLNIDITNTSTWESGYCMQAAVTNNTDEPIIWTATFDLGGTVASVWNAAVDDSSPAAAVFSGEEGYNTELGPEAETEFGACVDTNGNQ